MIGNGHEEARWIGCNGRQLVAGYDSSHIFGGLYDDQSVDAKLTGHCCLYALRMLGLWFNRTIKYRIAAVEQRTHVAVAKRFQQHPQVGHGHPLCLAYVYATKEGDKSCHCAAMVLVTRFAFILPKLISNI